MDELDALLAEAKQGDEAKRQFDLGRDRAFGRGMLQGSTMGFGDELAGVVGAAGVPPVPPRIAAEHPEDFPNGSADQIYVRERDAQRAANAGSEKERPYYYMGGQVVGALAAAPLMPGLALAKGASLLGRLGIGAANGLLQGGLIGAGTSNADLTKGQLGEFARDTGKASLIGGGLGIGAGVAGEGARVASEAFGKRAGSVVQRAADMAEKEQGKITSAATGSAGATTQQANRLIENIQRLKAGGNLTPQQLALLDSQQATIAELEQKLATSGLRDLPTKAAEKETADALAAEAIDTHPERVAKATEEILAPRTAGKHVLALAKRYWPVAAGSLIGHLMPGVGAGYGGLTGRALSPSIHAITRRLQQPAVQRLLALGGQKAAGGIADVLQATGTPAAIERGAAPALLPSMSGVPAMAQSDDLDSILAEAKALHAAQASRGTYAP